MSERAPVSECAPSMAKSDKPKTAPRWPKGPFPEKYRWAAVEARLAGAWEPRAGALDALGLAPRAGWDDPYVRLFEGDDLAAARAALAEQDLFAFRWRGSERAGTAGERAIGVVPSRDPIVAVIAVGVAGPQHGIGTAALVRFLAVLRAFAAWEIEELGEDALTMRIVPASDDAGLRIAERARQICPPLMAIEPQLLADRIAREQRLEIAY